MREEQKYQTTPEHFKFYRAEAERFIELLGLKDWRVYFEHSPLAGCMGQCGWNNEAGKVATITLGVNWEHEEPTEEELRKVAFHEVCHLLLADSYNVAVQDDLSYNQTVFALDRAYHGVIRRLENAVLPMLR